MVAVPGPGGLLSLLVVIGLLAPSSTAKLYRNILYAGDTLKATESLTSLNYSLIMQADCNLVLYHGSSAMWSSQTHGQDHSCYVTLRKDGNLVIYNRQADPLWTSNSWTREGNCVLVLQKDGNAVIYARARWDAKMLKYSPTIDFVASPEPTNILYPGETLKTTQSITWGIYRLTMQTDCNLVLYDSGKGVWFSGTNGKGTGCYLTMETDGNLSLYDRRNTRLWGTDFQAPEGNYVLILMRNRNFAVYGADIWSTNWDGVESSKGNISMMTN